MARFLIRLARSQTGAAAIEAAIAVPVLLLFGIGVSEVGEALRVQNALQYAVEGAARCAAINSIDCGTVSQVQALAASYSGEVQAPSSSFVVTDAACGKQVSVAYGFSGGIPGFGSFAPNIKATACHAT